MLTPFFSGWTRHPMADWFVLLPPGGLMAGPIRLREKLPLRSLRAFVDEALRESGAAVARASSVGRLERFVTFEGEHAGMVTVTIALEGQTVERTFALVAGEDLCAVIDGATSDPASFARYREVIRDLASSYYLGLGELRRRRYEYARPPGWSGLARPYATEWYAPRYPGQAAIITVFDARPQVGTRAEIADRSLTLENNRVNLDVVEALDHDSGLDGRYERGATTEGERRVHIVRARLADARFLYLAQLHAADDALEEARGALATLVASIRPVPPPGGSAPAPLVHWLD